MTLASARRRYVTDAVQTVSPARLVTMLYDGLSSDLVGAADALAAADLGTANTRLQRAQEIVVELRSSLDPTRWPGAASLDQLYGYLAEHLVHANVRKDAALVAHCRDLVEPLRDAWHRAAAELVGGVGDTEDSAGGPDPTAVAPAELAAR